MRISQKNQGDIEPYQTASFYSSGGLRKKNPEWYKEDLGILFGLLKEGKIKPSIEKRMSLEDAKQAHELIEDAAVKGRIVLMVNGK